MKVCDLGEDMQSIWVGGLSGGMFCAFDHIIRSECLFEKLESEMRVKFNFTDESLGFMLALRLNIPFEVACWTVNRG